jgi:hypothetical protein
MLRTHLIRSDLRPVSNSLSSGGVFWTNTQAASPTEILIPSPTLVFELKSSSPAAFAGPMRAQPVIPEPPSASRPAAGSDAEAVLLPVAEELPSDPLPTEAQLPDGSEPAEADEPGAHPSAEIHRESEPPAIPEAEPEQQLAAEAHRIELTIDSLPELELIEAIPVTVVSLGDKLFTATVMAIGLSGTGDTIGDALVTVKEQILVQYKQLTRMTIRDEDEEEHFQYLNSHIKGSVDHSATRRRSIWR